MGAAMRLSFPARAPARIVTSLNGRAGYRSRPVQRCHSSRCAAGRVRSKGSRLICAPDTPIQVYIADHRRTDRQQVIGRSVRRWGIMRHQRALPRDFLARLGELEVFSEVVIAAVGEQYTLGQEIVCEENV